MFDFELTKDSEKHPFRKHLQIGLLIWIAAVSVFSIGCAGPTTPLGAPWISSKNDLLKKGILGDLGVDHFKDSQATISIEPENIALETPTKLFIHFKTKEKLKSNFKFLIRYNGKDVTRSFSKLSKEHFSNNEVILESEPLRFAENRDHRIEVFFGNGTSDFSNAYIKNISNINRAVAGSTSP